MKWVLTAATLALVWCEEIRFAERSGCSAGDYYDVVSLACKRCAVNESLVPASDGFSCECDAGSRLRGGAGAACERCARGALATRDRRACVPRRCVMRGNASSCLVCGGNQISLTQNPDGSPLKEVRCITCKAGYRPSQDKMSCEPCTLVSADKLDACACKKSESLVKDICIPKAFARNREEFKPKDKIVWNHDAFLQLLKLEFVCMKENVTACQALANMCVLSFYVVDHNGPCHLWLKSNPLSGLPKLMYGENEAYSILNQKTVPASYRFTGDTQNWELQFAMALHSRRGDAVQFSRSADEWASLCPPGQLAASHSFRLGQHYRSECKVTAKEILSQERSYIISPYLLYKNATNKTDERISPIAVAIKIDDDDYIKSSDKKNLKLFHRYFIVDKWSRPISNSSERRTVLAWYLRSVTLNVKIEYAGREHTNKIYTPLLKLQYGSLQQSDLASDSAITLSFALVFEMAKGGMIRAMEISVGVLAGLVVLQSLLQTWGFSRRSACSSTLAAIHFLLFACGNLSNALYLVAFGASLHSLVMFRWQHVAYTLPPTSGEELLLEAFVASAFALKLVEAAWVTWKQCRVDVFLLDWRTPHLVTGGIHYDNEKDSFWRKLVVAKQWCAMQTDRSVSVPACVIMSLALIEVINAYEGSVSEHRSYRYARSAGALAGVYCALAAAGAALRRVRAASRLHLADTCAAADVSLLVFEEELYAHYVHGRCGDGVKNGESGEVQARGLLPSSPHRAFSIICDPNFKIIYNKLSEGLTYSEPRAGGNIKGSTPSTTNLTNKAESLETIEDFNSRAFRDPRKHSHALLTKFLASFIDQALEGCGWTVRERGAAERLLGVELAAAAPGASVLLRDASPRTHSYLACTNRGAEWSLATLELFLFSFIEWTSGSRLLAALFTLTTWKVMQVFRYEAARRNFIRKANMDGLFID